MKITGSNRQSKCAYCGGEAYGKGCIYSPSKVHIHTDDPLRCIYCGSFAFGTGCTYNPFAKVHVHGVDYNQIIKDSVKHALFVGVLIEKLNQPITSMPAYIKGIINENGDIIKFPETLEEHNAFNVFDLYVLKMKKMLGPKVDLLNTELLLTNIANTKNNQDMLSENKIQQFELELKLKEKINNIVAQLKDVFDTGVANGVSILTLESFLVENFD